MTNSQAASSFYSDSDDDSDVQSPVKSERNLLAAVLARAICDAFGTAQCERHIVRNARQWLFGKLDPKEAFSFCWISNHLDIDAVALQNSLRNYETNPEDIQERLSLLK
jgi:hypothetical protein